VVDYTYEMCRLYNAAFTHAGLTTRYICTETCTGCSKSNSALNGATREGAKRAEAPPLAKSKLRKKIKYRIVLIFLCLSALK